MMYKSTRSINESCGVPAAQAIKQGLAADGGLFMPEYIPKLPQDALAALAQQGYVSRAAQILSMFLDDYTIEELTKDCQAAYCPQKFPGGAAPCVQIDDRLHVLELWHGPTCAFKDMALQIMPRLLRRALDKTKEDRTAMILVATSGDTGKAALEGYRDLEKIKIKVYYPVDGVSRVQKLQMATQGGANVDVCAIRGNFDDAQSGVKRIFSDAAVAEELNRRRNFSIQRQFHQLGASSAADRILRLRLLRHGPLRLNTHGGADRHLRADRKLRQHFRCLYRKAHGTARGYADLRLQPKQHSDRFSRDGYVRP